jgi:hypothetical protein
MQNQIESHPFRQPSPSDAEFAVDLVSHGVPFRLTAKSPELLELMREQAPFGSIEHAHAPQDLRTFTLRSSVSQARYEVLAGDELLACGGRLQSVLAELGGHMMVHVAEYAPRFVFIHAGVVELDSRVLLLPGASHAGKSTLVAELVRAGATYYSDEFALIDAAGRVHPFPRDLRMRQPGSSRQTPVQLTQLNGRAGTDPLPVSLVVFAQFVANARWAPDSMSQGRAVLELLLHTIPVRRTPGQVLAALSTMMCNATAWCSQRGDAAVAARSLLEALTSGEAPA